MLSVILSYFSIREKSLLKSSPFSVCRSSSTNPYIRSQRSEKTPISFLALRMDSSGVCIRPIVMKERRDSSSSTSTLGLMTLLTIFSMKGTNQIMMSVLATLKAEWKAARTTLPCSLAYSTSELMMLMSTPTMLQTSEKKGCSTQRTHSTPMTLMNMCEKAVLRADTLAPNAAMFEVMVVPMFSPNTRMIPSSMGSTPVEQSVIVMAMMAADDCTHKVRTVPMSRKTMMVHTLLGSNAWKKSRTSGFLSSSIAMPVLRRVTNPRKRNAIPKRNSPMFLYFFMYERMMPTKAAM